MNFKNVFAMTLAFAAIALAQQAAPAQQPASGFETPAQAAPAAETPAAQPAVAQESAPAEASAQAPEAAVPAPAASAAAPAAPVAQAPVAQAPAAPAEAPAVKEEPVPEPVREPTAFDVLHGSAYNTVGNEAAADNVDGLLGRPDLFFGKKFFYIEPAAERGVVSLGRFFAAMDISGDLGRATAGYASNGFGAEVRLGLGQYAIDGDNGKKSGSIAGDDWGFTVSKVLGKVVAVISTDWETFQDENNVEPKVGKSTEEAYRDLNVNMTVSNAPSGIKHFWSAGVGFVRHENEQKVGGDVVNDNVDSHIKVSPFFNYGAVAMQNSKARLLLGLNSSVPVYYYDEQERVDSTSGDTVKTKLTDVGVDLAPNILGEVLLGNHVMLFGEATYRWRVFDYTKGTDESDDEYTAMESVSNQVRATVGFRYQYEDWIACEFAFGDSFFTDTKSIFNGEGVFVSFGGFIYF